MNIYDYADVLPQEDTGISWTVRMTILGGILAVIIGYRAYVVAKRRGFNPRSLAAFVLPVALVTGGVAADRVSDHEESTVAESTQDEFWAEVESEVLAEYGHLGSVEPVGDPESTMVSFVENQTGSSAGGATPVVVSVTPDGAQHEFLYRLAVNEHDEFVLEEQPASDDPDPEGWRAPRSVDH